MVRCTVEYTFSSSILLFAVDTKVTPIWNTMAVIPGYIKDEIVVMGNHRDGTFHTANIDLVC